MADLLSDDQTHVLISMGVALLIIQSAERVLRLCMTFVLQKASPLTIEALEAQEAAEQKKTLGHFIAEMRNRADLAEDFDALLSTFLAMRNIFCHHISDVPGWSLDTDDGRRVANAFIADLVRITDKVQSILLGLVRAWQESASIGDNGTSNNPVFGEIDRVYKPLVDQIFFEKEAAPSRNATKPSTR